MDADQVWRRNSVWAAALALGAIWALAVFLFLRAALKAPRGASPA